MKGTRAASRYAKSLLELAIEKNILDDVKNDMQYLTTVVNENNDLQLLLKSPIVKSDKKITVFKAIFDQFNELSTLFIELITKNGRENILPNIAISFDKLYKEHKGIVDVEVVSAKALDAATKELIISKIKATYDGEYIIKEKIDESLIGGFKVSVGDHQIDASVQRQFRDLRQVLMN